MADILIVEDDLDTGAALEAALCAKGHAVFRAFSMAEALSVMDMKLRPDLVLLDRGLPDGDGLQLCMLLRERPEGARVPILFLTAKGGVSERVKGLCSGGDDYLVKPFAAEELLARVEALLRRPARWSLRGRGGLALDVGTRTAKGQDGRVCRLSPIECKLLALFLERPGEVLSRSLLAGAVYGEAAGVRRGSALGMTLSRLRKKLAPLGARLTTLRGRGYTLKSVKMKRC